MYEEDWEDFSSHKCVNFLGGSLLCNEWVGSWVLSDWIGHPLLRLRMCELLSTCPPIMLSWHAQQHRGLSIMGHRFSYTSFSAHESLKECRNVLWLSVGCRLWLCSWLSVGNSFFLSPPPFLAPPFFKGHHHPVHQMPFFMKATPKVCIICRCIVKITPQVCSSCPLYQDVSFKLLMLNCCRIEACFTSFAEVGVT